MKPTDREVNFALLTLRALQIGLSFNEAFFLDVGMIKDLLVEKSNDSFEYATVGDTGDVDRLFGG